MRIRPLKSLLGPVLAAGLALAGTAQEDTDSNTAILRRFPDPLRLTDRAPRLAAEGKYKEALDIYLEALERYPNFVLPVEENRFIGVRRYVLRCLAEWPPDGLKVYRDRYDPDLLPRFRRARDAGEDKALRDLVHTYPLSKTAGLAAVHLARRLHEEGRDNDAADILDSWLKYRDGPPTPEVAAFLGSLYGRLGDSGRLAALTRFVRDHFPGAKIVRNGRQVPLEVHLKEAKGRAARDAPSPAEGFPSNPAWPMYGGNPASTARPAHDFIPRGQAWEVLFPGFHYSSAERAAWGSGGFERWNLSDHHPVFPAAVHGIAVLHNGRTVRAYPLFDRRPDPLWTFEVAQPRDPILMFEPRLIHTTLIHRNRVYVTLLENILEPEVRNGYLVVKYPIPKRALYCFDLLSGRKLWKIGGRVDATGPLDALSFTAAPTPVGDRLYVAAMEQRRPEDPYKHYVVCLDARTGEALWKTYVTSGGTEINLFGNSIREAVCSKVAVDDGRVYTCSNLGVIAALDRNTGEIEWVTRYPQLPVRPTRRITPSKHPLLWRNSPLLAKKDLIVATPVDGHNLIALDARDGRLRYWIRPREPGQALYGSTDSMLVLGGSEIHLYELETGRFGGTIPTRRRGLGTGVVTRNRIFQPTLAGLSVIDLASRKEIAFVPWQRGRSNPRNGGNVTIAENSILITAGENILEVYPEPIPRQALEARVRAAAGNPVALYRCALRWLQLGESERAFQLLEPIATGDADPGIRREARRMLMAVYRHRAAKHLADGKFEQAERFLRRALPLAETIREKVELSLQLKTALVRLGRYDRVVQLMQELIEQAPDLTTGGRTVFEIAREEIESALRAAGSRKPYEPFDRKARQLHARAKAGGSIPDLRKVARTYPNSRVAPTALLDACTLLASTGRWSELFQTARTLADDYPGTSHEINAHAYLVISLERRGLFGSARRLLFRMQRKFPDGRVTIPEEASPVRRFVRRRLQRPEYARPITVNREPSLELPLQKVAQLEQFPSKPGRLLRPQGRPSGAAADLAALNYSGHVGLLNTASGKHRSVKTPAPPKELAWFGETLVVLGETFMLGVNAPKAEIRWRREPMGRIQVGKAAGDLFVTGATSVGSEGGYVSSFEAVHPDNGRTVWETRLPGHVRQMFPLEEDLLAVLETAERTHFVTLRLDSGTPAGRATFGPREEHTILHADAEQVITRVRGRFPPLLEAYETGTYDQVLWRRRLEGNARVRVGSSAVAILTSDRILRVDRRTGKLTHILREPLTGLTDAVFRGDRLYVLDDRDLYAFDGDRVAAHARLPERRGREGRRLMVSGEHIVVLEDLFEPQSARFRYAVHVYSGSLKALQRIRSESESEVPPSLLLSNGLLRITTGTMLEVYR